MILGTRGSAQQSRRGYAVPALPLAELDAEPAVGIVPSQRARGCDCEAGSALQAGSVLHGDGPVGFLAVHVGRAAGDDGLAGSGGLSDLLVDLDASPSTPGATVTHTVTCIGVRTGTCGTTSETARGLSTGTVPLWKLRIRRRSSRSLPADHREALVAVRFGTPVDTSGLCPAGGVG